MKYRGLHARHASRPRADSEEEPDEEPSVRHKRARLAQRPAAASEEEESRSSDSEGGSSSGGEGGSGSDSEPGSDTEPTGGDIPFGELEKLRQDGSTSAAAMRARARALKGKASFKREGRHRPMEMSSKKPVPVFRETLQGGKREVRDPRFESLSGQYNEEKFKKQYAFLFDEKLPAEKRELRAAMQKAKNPAKRAELQARLTQVEQQLRNEDARRRKDTFAKEIKAKEKAAVAGGKRPFYLKKSEQKRLELVAKYEALKASGGLEKYMAKRRKKNAAKDHRYLPVGRRGGGGGGDGDE